MLADGYRLEGGVEATLDPSSDRIAVSVARALEIKKHHPTGRVYADVELVGDLGGLLGAVAAVAADAQAFPIRDDVDGRPAFRSIEVPALATTGVVRARRRIS